MNDANKRLGVFRRIGIKYPEPKRPKKRGFDFALLEVLTGVGIFLAGGLLLSLFS